MSAANRVHEKGGSDGHAERIRRELPRLPAHDVAELARVLERLVEALGPEQIYAFGSHARGDAAPDRDVDLLVVVPKSDEPGYRRDQAALRAVGFHHVPLDVLVVTRKEFDDHIDSPTSLSATVRREGRTLYASA